MRLILILIIVFGLVRSAATQPALSDKMNQMEHGPFVSTTLSEDPLTASGIVAYKGIVVDVGTDAAPAAVAFDTDLLRVAQAWTGGLLHWYPARNNLQEFPSPDGFAHFGTAQGPGWSRNGRFKDPRAWPYGPLPEDHARYLGLYVRGDQVVFSYRVGEHGVLESHGFTQTGDHPLFTRTINLDAAGETLSLRVLQAPDGPATTLDRFMLGPATGYVQVRAGGASRVVGFQGLPEAAAWRLADRHLVLDLPPSSTPHRFALTHGPVLTGVDAAYMAAYLRAAPAVPDLDSLRQPGPARWPLLETEAVTGRGDGPFVVDELTLPVPNPWHSYLRLSGIDFLPDGRAVVTSLSGDVWLVSGLGETLGTLGWKRFATGLNQPLGVRVVDGRIYVTGRDQITRLYDRNGDDEADFYESFNNDVMAATNFHAFTMNLETDAEGNFYFARSTPWPPVIEGAGPPRPAEITPHHGVLFRLSPDGRDLDVVATGLRNPNGLAVSPDGIIVYSDNQGNWVPTSHVMRITEGGFHGFVPSAHGAAVPDRLVEPIVWLPQYVDNSPGTPVWITSASWPEALRGGLLLTSYGMANLSLLLTEEVDGVLQGGVLNLPLAFKAGTMRARFHDDGHLYVAGMTSWQSIGRKDGAFHRVRYTGQPLHLPVALHVKRDGLELHFSDPLDPEAATDVDNYRIEQWNYRWFEGYGSPRYSVQNPEEGGADPVRVHSVRLSEDGRRVLLEIDPVQPVMGMSIEYTLEAADGTPLVHTIYNTIHRVPDEPSAVGR